jgi:hypothetical protein
MHTSSKSRNLALVIAGTMLAAFAFAAIAGKQLTINGAVASKDVRVIDGKAFVPVADVAKAFDMTINSTASGFELIKKGGAGQIANDHVGKIGDEVFTGKWRFQVLEVRTAASYSKKHSGNSYGKDFEAGPNDQLVIADCRIKNGTQKKDELVLENWDGMNTALTDDREQSYPPKAYDVREAEHSPVGATFLPGAAIEFSIVFVVPKDAKPSSLIFTAMRYDDRAPFDQKKRPPTDIRIKL